MMTQEQSRNDMTERVSDRRRTVWAEPRKGAVGMRQRQSRREKSATILEQLADFARERVRRAREKLPLEEVRGQALALQSGDFAFERVLAEPDVSLICECKRASPSKGVIAEEFPYMRIAREYERGILRWRIRPIAD